MYLVFQNNCCCEVVLDQWCMDDISQNKMDWIIRTLQEADKVLIINSYGAFARYQAKLASQKPDNLFKGHHLERVGPVIFDDIFITQLDIVTEQFRRHPDAYAKFMMAYFAYTSTKHVLTHISPFVRFELPRNLEGMAGYLHNIRPPQSGESTHPLRGINCDEYIGSVEGRKLYEAMMAFTRFQKENPTWFEDRHVRVPNKETGPSGQGGLSGNFSWEPSTCSTIADSRLLTLNSSQEFSADQPLLADKTNGIPLASADLQPLHSAPAEPLQLQIVCGDEGADGIRLRANDHLDMLDSGFHDEVSSSQSGSTGSLEKKATVRWHKKTNGCIYGEPLLPNTMDV